LVISSDQKVLREVLTEWIAAVPYRNTFRRS